ncbi:MAG: FkbM family methyltransferase [Proteobacteria bacterium]|nr:FkbM family methyltransferase [Pseudomonadota bacterium]
MVKPEHRLEYNRWQAEEERKKRNFIYRFMNNKRMVWIVGAFFALLLLIPLSALIWEPKAFNPDYVCGLKARVVMVESDYGYGLLADTRDEYIMKIVRSHELMHEAGGAAIKKLLKPGDVAIDIGAGFGYHTMLMAQTVGGNGFVYSFEPRAEVAHLLEASSLINKLHQVRVKNALLYSSNVNVLLEQFENYMEVSRIVIGKSMSEVKRGSMEIASAYKVDDLVSPTNVKLIRINALGAELAVLEGAQNIMSHSPKISVLMYWDMQRLLQYSNVSAFIDDMLDLGFEFWSVGYDGNLRLLTKDVLIHNYRGDIIISRDHIN